MNKALFLDRDGVINEDIKYLYEIEKFKFCKGIFEVVYKFQKKGYLIFVVTNQSGIGRGYYTHKAFKKLTNWMLNRFKKRGINIQKVYHCPHTPKQNCKCRKPNNQMFENAIKEFDIDVENSWIIGDKISDIEASKKSRVKHSILIDKNHSIKEDNIDFFIVNNTYEITKLLKEKIEL